MPLLQRPDSEHAVFFSVPSCQRAREYRDAEATGNARILSRLPTLLVCARFAQYLKVLTRDRIGSGLNRGECEHLLNRWISTYVTVEPDSSEEVRARYPLREARVEVSERPGVPGMYVAMVYLRPHLGVAEVPVSGRMPVALFPL